MFSHTLDIICEKPALHGHQCGLGSIMTAYLQGADWEGIRDALKNCGSPVTSGEIGLEGEKIVQALSQAHRIRQRHTILRDGLSMKQAEEVARATGVIS